MSDKALKLIAKEKIEQTGRLDLANCSLTNIPEEIFDLTELRELNLCNKRWDETKHDWKSGPNKGDPNVVDSDNLSDRFGKLIKLIKLSIGGNDLDRWTLGNCDILGELKNLQSLDISTTNVNDFGFLNKLTGLRSLNLNFNEISDINFLEFMPDLESIFLCGSNISDYNILRSCKCLQTLSLSGNSIQNYDFLENLTSLVHLDLRRNKITDTHFLKHLHNLQRLDLRSNNISDINFLVHLPVIRYLDLSFNRIKDISGLAEMKEIQTLKLSHNHIRDISPLQPIFKRGIEIKDHDTRGIIIGNNPLTISSQEKIYEGREAISEYFNERDGSDDKEAKYIKLIFWGNSSSGKSVLFNYLVNNKLDLSIEAVHNMEMKTWRLDDKIVIMAWDLGSQDYYHAIHRLLLNKNAVYVLVWEKDTNNNELIPEEIFSEKEGETRTVTKLHEHFHYHYWLSNIHLFSEGTPPVFLVENKCRSSVESSGEVRLVQYDEVKVTDAFPYVPEDFDPESEEAYAWEKAAKRLKEDIHDKIKDFGSHETMTCHYGIHNRILIESTKRERISLSNFKTIVEDEIHKTEPHTQIDQSDVFDVLDYLKEIGTVLYYPEISSLKDQVIINPVLITNTIGKILNEELKMNKGIFSFDYVRKVVESDKEAQIYIDLMLKFELIFRFEHSIDKFVASHYLNDSEEIFSLLNWVNIFSGFMLSVKAKFHLPLGLIDRLIARYGARSKSDGFWEKGILFYEIIKNERYPVFLDLRQKDIITIRSRKTDEGCLVCKRVLDSIIKIIRSPKELYLSIEPRMPQDSWFSYEKLLEKTKLGFTEIESTEGKVSLVNEFASYIPLKQKPPMKVFVSYSKDDIDDLEKLKIFCCTLFRDKILEEWDDTRLILGEDWETRIDKELDSADMIIFLVSQKMIATEFIQQVELKKALNGADSGELKIVSLILKPCDFKNTPFQKYNTLFKAIPLSQNGGMESNEEAWVFVANRLRDYYYEEFKPELNQNLIPQNG